MATTSTMKLKLKLFVPLILLIVSLSSINAQKNCTFDKIFQFGDSLADTGNFIRQFPSNFTMFSIPFSSLPYNTTGRASDGFLMIDYITMSAGLPLLPPYKDSEADFSHGVNFAVSGSTALSSSVLAEKHEIYSEVDLDVQMDWMSAYFKSIGGGVHEGENVLFIGGVGGADYNYGLLQGRTMDELINLIPDVVDAIMTATRKLVVEFGARKVVVPGILPIGCLPIYKTAFKTNNSEAYDENGCIKELNDLAKNHNDQLGDATILLWLDFPGSSIVYGDYYNAYQSLLQLGKDQGFEMEKACCGIGGEYNYDMSRTCGAPDVPVCPDPHRYVSFDGVHLTQEANKIMSEWLINESFSTAILCEDIDHD